MMGAAPPKEMNNMTRKTKVLEQLVHYFLELGYIPTLAEYKELSDAPIRSHLIKRELVGWSRLDRMIQVNFPAEYEILTKAAIPVAEKLISKTEAAKEATKESKSVVKK